MDIIMYRKIFLLVSLFNLFMLVFIGCIYNQLHVYINDTVKWKNFYYTLPQTKINTKISSYNGENLNLNYTKIETKTNIQELATKEITRKIIATIVSDKTVKNGKMTSDVKEDNKKITEIIINKDVIVNVEKNSQQKMDDVKVTVKPDIKVTEKPDIKVTEKTDVKVKPILDTVQQSVNDYEDDYEYDETYSSRIITENIYPETYLNKSSNSTSPMCPNIPPNLIGKIEVITSPPPVIKDLEKEYSWLKPGGHWSPPCIRQQNLAVIVPYRGRDEQLKLFLKHMHPFLKKQQLNYTIIVTEQEDDSLRFNKGQIMNTAYVEALKMSNFSCFIFHDVDLLPEDDRILYRCTETARHLTGGIDKWHYKLMYGNLFGGVVAVNKNIFKKVNGYSNKYFGWGGEDDEFKSRMDYHKVQITRYPNFAHYKMIKHKQERKNPNRYKLLDNNHKYYNIDGLFNLSTTVLSIEKKILYTRILVRVNENV